MKKSKYVRKGSCPVLKECIGYDPKNLTCEENLGRYGSRGRTCYMVPNPGERLVSKLVEWVLKK